ncbi:MAG: FmdB family transcriptional regulator [Anaerolineae bacterium]|nr:FmdB family transcriptional regulator [Anaerolineae bacterium]
MPVYTYRREDGTTFDYRQKFSDASLTVDPETGEPVTRIVQAAGIIFKGSGFYINDSKGASKTSTTAPAASKNGSKDSKEAKDSKETKAEPAPAKEKTPAPASTSTSSAAAD